jgi:hypothetical protein
MTLVRGYILGQLSPLALQPKLKAVLLPSTTEMRLQVLKLDRWATPNHNAIAQPAAASQPRSNIPGWGVWMRKK